MASELLNITACDLCGSNKRISWQCVQCEEKLCEGCKNIHLKGKATRNHEIKFIQSNEPAYNACIMSNFSTDHRAMSYYSPEIQCITPVTKKSAWIHSKRNSDIELFKCDGIRLKTFRFHEVNAMTIDDDRNILATCPAKGSIVSISPAAEIETLLSVKHIKPQGICVTSSEYIIASIVETESVKLTRDSVRLLYKMNNKGIVLETFGLEPEGLFTFPCRVKANINGDLVVLDKRGETLADIVVLDQNGVFRFRYQGQPLSKGDKDENAEKLFCVTDMTIDPNGGRIIIAEETEKQIHVIDQDGGFIQYLKTDYETDYIPKVIALFDDILWIGYNGRKVATFRYLL